MFQACSQDKLFIKGMQGQEIFGHFHQQLPARQLNLYGRQPCRPAFLV
jgi:hypothetical protein